MGKVKAMLIDLMNEFPDAKNYSELLRLKMKKENRIKKFKSKKNYGKEKTN